MVACTSTIEALASEIRAAAGAGDFCHFVIRFDYATLAPLGHAIGPCGIADWVRSTEAEARAIASSATGLGGPEYSYVGADGAWWIFYRAPRDVGGVAIVSNHLHSDAVLGAELTRATSSELVLPASWRPGDELGTNCDCREGGLGGGIDLRDGSLIRSDDSRLVAVFDAYRASAFPCALRILDPPWTDLPLVALYASPLEPFSPDRAEWIVVVSAGFLKV